MYHFWHSRKQKNLCKRQQVCYVRTHESEWKEFTEATESSNPSGKWGDYKLVYRCADEPVRRYLSIEQDAQEKRDEMTLFLTRCGVTPETENIHMYTIMSVFDDPYFNIGVCKYMHQITARGSNGVLEQGMRSFCRRDKNNPTFCSVEQEGKTTACQFYDGEGLMETQAWRDLCHREAMGEFD